MTKKATEENGENMIEKKLIAIAEASKYTGLPKTFLRNLIYQNELQYMKSGVKYFIYRDSLDKYIASCS